MDGAGLVPGTEAGVGPRLVAGRYRLTAELGRGGMGVVWLGEDQLVGRRVAVKELRPPQGLSQAERETYGRRALQEARSAARIDHRGAVALFDVLPAAAADDAVYLIMELVQGPTLAQVIGQQGRLAEATVAAFGLQLLEVLAAAHALGVVHRDIKPANILVAAGGQVKLTDFGIAHTMGDLRLTRSGILGTQAYLAPELFESAPITPAADVWSLGATLYAAAEGRGPFDRDTTGATLRAILVDDLPAPRCSPALAAALAGMLQRDPGCRAGIGQARAALHAAAQAAPPPPPTLAAPAPGAPGLAATTTTGPPTTTAPRAAPAPGADRGPSVSPPPPPWAQRPTTRSPAPPPTPPPPPPVLVPTATPPAPGKPAATRPGRRRLMVAFTAAVVIAIAGGITGGILATRHGAATPSSTGTTSIALKLRTTLTDPSGGSAAKISFSPNSALVATTDQSAGPVLWNATSGSKLIELPFGNDGYYVAFSPDGRTLAYPNFDSYIQLSNVATSAPAGSLDDGQGNGSVADDLGAAFSPDGSTIASASRQGVQLWNAASHTVITTLSPATAVDTVVFSPDGKTLAAGDSTTGKVYVWDVSSRILIATLAPPITGKYYGPGSWFAFSPDSSTLAIGPDTTKAPGIRLWNVADRTFGATLTDPHTQGVSGVAFSPDGKVLAAADVNGTAYLWDVATHRLIATQQVNSSGVADVAFSPDGRTLATSDAASHIFLWNVIES